MTVLEVLTAATDYLGKQGVESPRLNAEHLLAHVLGKKNRIDLYLEFERPLGEKERAPLRDLVHADITFKELSKQTGLGEKTLHRMLSRRGNPTTRNLFTVTKAICESLGITPQFRFAT